MALGSGGTAFLSAEPAWARRLRLSAFAAVFVALAAWTAFGFWSYPQLLATVWTPSGHTRFLAFAAGYMLALGALHVVAPGRLPVFLMIVAGAATCGAVGIGAPGAVALFFLSSLVLGRVLLWGR